MAVAFDTPTARPQPRSYPVPMAAARPEAKKHREWVPRMWEGSDFFAWLRLLTRNRFAVEPACWYIAAIVTGKSLLNTGLGWLQHARYADRVAATPAPHDPLFVLGHWRTGTTLLHELLILDARHTYPTTHDCIEPCHHLLSADFYHRYMGFLLPDRRPMDNVAFGWSVPQEDEMALALLGLPSMYTDFAFVNRPPLYPGALDLSGLTSRELRAWKRGLVGFVRRLASRDPRRLVLKSPPHTARVPVLLELFPKAKFVHIRRDPYTLFASTVHLWMKMGEKHGFQTPRGGPELEEKVFRQFLLIHERYEAGKKQIPAGHLVEVRYEDLIADFVGVMEQVYDGLGLGGFEAVRPKVEAFAAKRYERNRYAIDDQLRAKIKTRWGDAIREQGYA